MCKNEIIRYVIILPATGYLLNLHEHQGVLCQCGNTDHDNIMTSHAQLLQGPHHTDLTVVSNFSLYALSFHLLVLKTQSFQTVRFFNSD